MNFHGFQPPMPACLLVALYGPPGRVDQAGVHVPPTVEHVLAVRDELRRLLGEGSIHEAEAFANVEALINGRPLSAKIGATVRKVWKEVGLAASTQDGRGRLTDLPAERLELF